MIIFAMRLIGSHIIRHLHSPPQLLATTLWTRYKKMSTATATAAGSARDDTLVQYVAVRKDLKWPLGALLAQACHAAAAATWLSKDDPTTIAYHEDLDSMHKIILGSETEGDLRDAAAKLEAAGITCKLWIEQPENIVTALASKPAPRSSLQPHFKAFKLLR